MVRDKVSSLFLNLVVLIAIFFCSCAYHQRVAGLLKDSTLLYCDRDNETIYRPLSRIIEMRGDSIFEAGSRCDSLQEWYHLKHSRKDPSHLYIPFQVPYILKRRGKQITLLFHAKPKGTERQRSYRKDQYLLNRKDSIVCTDLTYLCNQEIGYSKYLGDTVLTIQKFKLKCLIFREYYLRSKFGTPSRDLTITRYFEKTTLIPIRIDTDFYEGAGFKLPSAGENAGYSILNSIIPIDSLRKKLVYRTLYCHY